MRAPDVMPLRSASRSPRLAARRLRPPDGLSFSALLDRYVYADGLQSCADAALAAVGVRRSAGAAVRDGPVVGPAIVRSRLPVPDTTQLVPYRPERIQPVLHTGGMFGPNRQGLAVQPLGEAVLALLRAIPSPASFAGPTIAVDAMLDVLSGAALPNAPAPAAVTSTTALPASATAISTVIRHDTGAKRSAETDDKGAVQAARRARLA